MSLEQDIQDIKERNKRVESEKAWETSWTRALSIAVFTYLIAGVWLVAIHDSAPWLKAFVPSIGFLLSTATLPAIERHWTRANTK